MWPDADSQSPLTSSSCSAAPLAPVTSAVDWLGFKEVHAGLQGVQEPCHFFKFANRLNDRNSHKDFGTSYTLSMS